MGKPFFSVIVPAHNSAEYIRKCMRSVKMQTFTDYELIVVCDKCTDNTAQVALGYADKTLIRGYGMDGLARNAGIEAAEGEWIMFLDDDDWWIHEYVLEMAKDKIDNITFPVDMLLFDFIWKNAPPHKSPYYVQDIDNVNIAVWSKAFRRGFIGDTRFPNVYSISDAYFHGEMMDKNPRIKTWDMPMYYYNYLR